MSNLTVKTFDAPDETRSPDKTTVEVLDLGPAKAYIIEPGHDAWVVGDEPMVGYEFESTTAATYAKS